MKTKSCLLAAAVLASAVPMTVDAVPYASKIRLGSTLVEQGAGTAINYNLNMAADTVTIEIYDAGDTPGVDAAVASFAGTVAAGANSVAWDGTVDNAGGAVVPEANDYIVSIRAQGSTAAGWAEYSSNRSVGQFGPTTSKETLFNGYSAKDVFVTHNEDSDLFGLVGATSSYAGTTPSHAAVIVFNTALDVDAGDDGMNSRVLRHPTDDTVNVGSQDTWGITADPDDPDTIWVCGQDTTTASILNAENPNGYNLNLTNADPGALLASTLYPRGIRVRNIGPNKFAFITRSNGTIERIAINSSNEVSAVGENLLSITSTTRYSKAVEFDASGNMYWVNRHNGGSLNGRIYRWDAALVDVATAGSLTDANASWVVEFPADAQHIGDIAIDPTDGEVYVAVAGSGADRGIYLVGNVATATLGSDATPHALTSGDQVVDFADTVAFPPSGWAPSSFGTGIEFDKFGNLFVTENAGEQIRAFTQGGASDNRTSAPTSQLLDIVLTSTVGDSWTKYE